MAIVDDVIVVPRTFLEANDLLQTSFAAQPPHFGVTSGFDAGNDPPNSTTVNVLWDTTVFDLAVPINSLRQIVPAQAASISQFGGKLVRSPLNSQSEEYIGAVILLGGIIFNPSDNGPVVEFAVIKSIGPGLFFWVSKIAELAVVPFR